MLPVDSFMKSNNKNYRYMAAHIYNDSRPKKHPWAWRYKFQIDTVYTEEIAESTEPFGQQLWKEDKS